MENRPLGQEEQDDSDSESSSKKKRGGTRLSRYLSGLRHKEQEDTSESETTDEKPKRFRRLFNKLFPSVVEIPRAEKAGEQEHHFDPENWFSWMKTQAENQPTETTSEQQPLERLIPHDTVREPIPEELPEPEVAQTSLEENQSETPDSNVGEQVIQPEQAADALPLDIEPAAAVERELYNREEARSQEITPGITSGSPETVDHEVVVERGPGMVLPVALVGLEHLGRKKADKKLEKRVNEKITSTNQEVKQGAALQQELETLTRQNQAQLEALKRARAQEALDLNRAVEQIERPNADRIAAAPEIVNPSPERHTETTEILPRIEKQEKLEEVQPQKIFEQVADAAEHDIAVERVFERSHEVKDDLTVPGAAASIGAVMASQVGTLPVPQRTVAEPVQPVASKDGGTLPFVSDKVAAEAYRQAMKAGFWAAVIIIILGSIAYLVIK